jgi:DNA mismatch repair protein MutL
VQQNDRPWFTISPGNTAQQILPQILKQVRQTDLQYLAVEVPTPSGEREEEQGKHRFARAAGGDVFTDIWQENSPPASSAPPASPALSSPSSKIQLVLGLPDRCHRRRADWVKVATNRRMVRSPELEQTILAALARTCPRDRFPVCFLHLQVCPSQLDWNRHPAKAEMYLHSLSYWQEQVSCAIEQALRISPTNLPEATQSERVAKLLKVSEEQGAYNANRSVQSAPEDDKNTKKAAEIGLIELRAIAQVHSMYILAEHPTGMWLIEQHIAHERVLYEQICDRWQIVPLEPPTILNNLTSAQVEQLQRIGLDIEPFGEQLWAIRSAPELLTKRDDCAAALWELSLGGDLQTAQVATACRSAIRNGTPLSLSDMQTLLDQWKTTRNPRTCPHGRPIYLSLEESALARFFRRHWVIGKSHGI